MSDVDSRADSVRYWAGVVGGFEHDLAEEIVRLIATGTPSYQAQRMAEVKFAESLAFARAEYEIALARLRRA